jgi:hypothetical protein
MGWTIGVLGFNSWQGLGIFLFTTTTRTALGPTQPPIQGVSGALSLRVKQPGCEADHSLPSSAKVKERVELYLHSPKTPSWYGDQLKHIALLWYFITSQHYFHLPISHITNSNGADPLHTMLMGLDVCIRYSLFPCAEKCMVLHNVCRVVRK